MGNVVDSFTLVMMGARRGKKRNLKQLLSEDGTQSAKSINRGRGQEITGVSLPAAGAVKGWEFGNDVRMACANVDGQFYALQGECPRCGFDLWKGDVIADDPGFKDLPRLACPTCATTFSLVSGKPGPPLKRKGLAGFVGNLAKSATATESEKTAKAFQITRD